MGQPRGRDWSCRDSVWSPQRSSVSVPPPRTRYQSLMTRPFPGTPRGTSNLRESELRYRSDTGDFLFFLHRDDYAGSYQYQDALHLGPATELAQQRADERQVREERDRRRSDVLHALTHVQQ